MGWSKTRGYRQTSAFGESETNRRTLPSDFSFLISAFSFSSSASYSPLPRSNSLIFRDPAFLSTLDFLSGILYICSDNPSARHPHLPTHPDDRKPTRFSAFRHFRISTFSLGKAVRLVKKDFRHLHRHHSSFIV
ncbi:hypothetical protein KKH27_10150 [bacterium]|nr:hypothetical protein [bacterium]